MKNKIEKLNSLKKGDKIVVKFLLEPRKAKVLENYINAQELYIKIYESFLISTKMLVPYSDNRLNLFLEEGLYD